MTSIDAMREYVSVIENRSFSAAARELYLSQPTITRHIRDLERTLGVVLLERSTHHVEPTEAGLVVYEGFSEILERYGRIENQLERLRTDEEGEIVLAVLYHAISEFALPAVTRFLAAHPDSRVSFSSCQPHQTLAQLESGSADVALLFEPLQPTEHFDFIPIAVSELRCVVDEASTLADAESISFSQLIDLTMVYFSSYTPDPRTMGDIVGCTRFSDAKQIDMAAMCLRDPSRFTFLDDFLVDKLDRRLRFIPIAPDPPTLTYGFACRKDDRRATVRAFMDTVRKANPTQTSDVQ